MREQDAIRVFIGGQREHKLPIEVLMHSIARRTRRRLMMCSLMEVEARVPIPSRWRAAAPTSFSFQRFIIPEACEFKGKALYLDSDMIVLHDIGGMWDTHIPGDCNIATVAGVRHSAVMLIDCERARWRIADLCGRLDRQELTYGALSNLQGDFAAVAPALDPLWHCIDVPERTRLAAPNAKLLHYTDMDSQPWLHADHPCEAFWTDELLDAVAVGAISIDLVMDEIERGHVRPSLATSFGSPPPYSDDAFVPPDNRRRASVNASTAS